jgi:hypothetical protein
MASDLDRHILVITEPTIKLDPMVFDSGKEEDPEGKKISKENGSLTPAIRINNIDVDQSDLHFCNISISKFLPEINVKFMDSQGHFRGDSLPRDGDVVSLRIAARQEKVFKDIRIDFDIIRCSGNQAEGEDADPQAQYPGEYSIFGRMKVPKILAEESKGYGRKTSLDHLEQIATELELGFATNIDSTDDEMARFCAYMPKITFITDIIKHGYIDDESFVVGKIDPYYYLNYVDLNKVINSNNDLEASYLSKLQENINKNPEDGDENNEIEGTLMLTNHPSYQSSSQFISNFKIINESGEKTAKMGYKMKLQYFENDSEEGLLSFDIEPRASKKMSDIEEPMKGRRSDKTRYKEEVKQKFVGRMDVDKTHGNMNPNHYFGAIQNKMNLAECGKMKLEVLVENMNPALYPYMKIPVFITAHNKSEVDRLNALKEKKEEKGFPTMGEDYGEDIESDGGDKIAMDEFHSGFYIIEDIEYMYDYENGKGIQQKVTLLRREWPTKLNQVEEEVMDDQSPPAAPAPEPDPNPAPEPAPEEPAEPTPEEKLGEPVFDLNFEMLEAITNSLGSWKDYSLKFQWTANDKTLVKETPKIKVKFVGPSTSEINASVSMEDTVASGNYGWKYNTTLDLPKDTFKDKEGNYTLEVTLTYKDQTFTKNTKLSFAKWLPGKILKQGATESNKKQYRWEVVNSTESGIFEGRFTKKSEALEYNSPVTGRKQGTDYKTVLEETEEASELQMY